MRVGRGRVRTAGSGLLVALAAGVGCSSRLGLPEPGSQEGGAIVDLWRALLFTAVALGGLVVVLLAWCILRYRRRGHPDLTGVASVRTAVNIITTVIGLRAPGMTLFRMPIFT
ncbi:MAG: hypothetical protein ACRDYV_19960, partial [Acidimicrobiia bacterium]